MPKTTIRSARGSAGGAVGGFGSLPVSDMAMNLVRSCLINKERRKTGEEPFQFCRLFCFPAFLMSQKSVGQILGGYLLSRAWGSLNSYGQPLILAELFEFDDRRVIVGHAVLFNDDHNFGDRGSIGRRLHAIANE